MARSKPLLKKASQARRQYDAVTVGGSESAAHAVAAAGQFAQAIHAACLLAQVKRLSCTEGGSISL